MNQVVSKLKGEIKDILTKEAYLEYIDFKKGKYIHQIGRDDSYFCFSGETFMVDCWGIEKIETNKDFLIAIVLSTRTEYNYTELISEVMRKARKGEKLCSSKGSCYYIFDRDNFYKKEAGECTFRKHKFRLIDTGRFGYSLDYKKMDKDEIKYFKDLEMLEIKISEGEGIRKIKNRFFNAVVSVKSSVGKNKIYRNY
jgi:hypothetical protein